MVFHVAQPSPDVIKLFERLGLGRYESSVLLALVANGKTQQDYKEIMHSTDVPYGRVHSILAALETKGLVRNVGGRPRRYQARPIGEIIESYLLAPMMDKLSGEQGEGEVNLRDLWIGQITSHVPIIKTGEDGNPASIQFAAGLDDLRKREHDEAMAAQKSIRLCIPGTAILNRRLNYPMSAIEEVSVEIVTDLPPSLFIKIIAERDRGERRRLIKQEKDAKRTAFYSLPNLTERLLIVDDRFVSVGTSVLPVAAHIYSPSICREMTLRFNELKRLATPVISYDAGGPGMRKLKQIEIGQNELGWN